MSLSVGPQPSAVPAVRGRRNQSVGNQTCSSSQRIGGRRPGKEWLGGERDPSRSAGGGIDGIRTRTMLVGRLYAMTGRISWT